MSTHSCEFEVTICVTPDAAAGVEDKLHAFEETLRERLSQVELTCGTALISLTWSEPQHAYRRFLVHFDQACQGEAVAFAVDAAAVAVDVAIPDGSIILQPSGLQLLVSPEVDRPCDA